MARRRWAGALRPVPVLAALAVALAGCGDVQPGPRYYGGGGGGGYYGGPGYYGSPFYYGDYGRYGRYDRSYGSRRDYGGRDFGGGGPVARPSPPLAGPSQDRLGQFWRGETRSAPPQDRLGQFWRGELRPPR